jgi:hypothetical protein
MSITERDMIGWGTALVGIVLGFAGAWLKLGLAEALIGAGPALVGLAGAWGYTAKAKA